MHHEPHLAPAVSPGCCKGVLSCTPLPPPGPLQPAQPSSSPEGGSPVSLLQDFPSLLSVCLLFFHPPCFLLPPVVYLIFLPSSDVGLIGSALMQAPWDSPVHSLSPAPLSSCPDLETDTPIVRSCPESHMLESRDTRQLSLPTPAFSYGLSVSWGDRTVTSALAFKHNI